MHNNNLNYHKMTQKTVKPNTLNAHHKPLKIAVLMDSIETIKPYKDSSFAMMLSAQERGHQLYYFQQHNIVVSDKITILSASLKKQN